MQGMLLCGQKSASAGRTAAQQLQQQARSPFSMCRAALKAGHHLLTTSRGSADASACRWQWQRQVRSNNAVLQTQHSVYRDCRFSWQKQVQGNIAVQQTRILSSVADGSGKSKCRAAMQQSKTKPSHCWPCLAQPFCDCAGVAWPQPLHVLRDQTGCATSYTALATCSYCKCMPQLADQAL